MKWYKATEIAERFGVKPVTARAWLTQGKFPNAKLEETPIGKFWLVPESDLESFKPKGSIGRPMTDTPSDHAIAKRKLRAKQKEKAV